MFQHSEVHSKLMLPLCMRFHWEPRRKRPPQCWHMVWRKLQVPCLIWMRQFCGNYFLNATCKYFFALLVNLMLGRLLWAAKKEVARVGDNLSIMEGELPCRHPPWIEGTNSREQGSTPTSSMHHTPEPGLISCLCAITILHSTTHICSSWVKNWVTESTPKCGGCRCDKCPQPRYSLSFREE